MKSKGAGWAGSDGGHGGAAQAQECGAARLSGGSDGGGCADGEARKEERGGCLRAWRRKEGDRPRLGGVAADTVSRG